MSSDRYESVLAQPEAWLTDLQRRWLRPRNALGRLIHSILYVVNWVSVRLLFRFSVEGRNLLPSTGPFIITPNHASPLDPPLLAAALPLGMLQNTFWAGKQSTVLRNRLRRVLSWLTRVIPIDDDSSALAPAVIALEQEHNLIWFPEGKRSLDGRLLEFRLGIAYLLMKCDVPVFPVFIQGAYAAFPSGAWLPRLSTRVVVRIGPALSASELGVAGSKAGDVTRVVDTLRGHVVQLRDQADVEQQP